MTLDCSNSPAQLSQPEGVVHCASCLTGNVCIFSKVDANAGVFSAKTHRQRVLQRGDFLHRQGDPECDLMHLRIGMLKRFVLNAQGDEFVTGFVLPGEICGSVESRGEQMESLVCVEDSVICELDPPSQAGSSQKSYYVSLVQQMREQAADELQRQVWARSSIQSRFAAFCVSYSNKLARLGRKSSYLPTPMSRTDLANYLGMSLESLSRIIHSLHQNQVICAGLSSIELTEPDTLEVLAAPAML